MIYFIEENKPSIIKIIFGMVTFVGIMFWWYFKDLFHKKKGVTKND
jgi:hypothetical protein